jgi:hypothetical protein
MVNASFGGTIPTRHSNLQILCKVLKKISVFDKTQRGDEKTNVLTPGVG